MIRANITRLYPSHIQKYCNVSSSIYIADYATQTGSIRGVEFYTEQPNDIECFSLINDNGLEIGYIPFNNKSFQYSNGKPRSQCECVMVPHVTTTDSWILFAELKYCQPNNNEGNLRKAVRQLYKTRAYYFLKGVFTKTNTCYLLASLPTQFPPFSSFELSPTDMMRLKSKHNVIMRFQNSAEISDDKTIYV